MALRTDREKCAHLLRRFGLGASEAELDFYLTDGLNGAIDKLLNYENVPEAVEVPITAFFNQKKDRLQIQGVQAWWMLRLLTTRRPLQERMTLFWHNHFATSASKVGAPALMFQQNELLRRNALAPFGTLLLEVSKDPAMLVWLDNQFNVKGKPNENYAREVMELFTLGIGHYTEKDIQEAARAFTGWAFRRTPGKNVTLDDAPASYAEFVFRRNLHDDGEKTVFGKTGRFDGGDVVSMLCGNPQTARRLVTKFWNWFVYPNPEPSAVEPFAKSFQRSGLDVKALIREIATSPVFYSAEAERKIVKSPVDIAVTTVRQLGVVSRLAPVEGGELGRPVQAVLAASIQATRAMGMMLFFPPNVAGWDGGAAWLSSATMAERMLWGELLFGHGAQGIRKAQVRLPEYSLFAGEIAPYAAAKRLMAVFDIDLPPVKVNVLEKAAIKATGRVVTKANANACAGTIARLMFGSPEFQFC